MIVARIVGTACLVLAAAAFFDAGIEAWIGKQPFEFAPALIAGCIFAFPVILLPRK